MNHLIAPQVIQFWEDKVLRLRSVRSQSRTGYRSTLSSIAPSFAAFVLPRSHMCRQRHMDQVFQEHYLGLAGGSG